MKSWTVSDIPSQQGKLAVITGATGGLGFETALALARAGANVVVTGRNKDKGALAVRRIRHSVPSARVRFELLDLANLASVREFASVLAADRKALDLLINNAGVMSLPTRRLTADGFEMQFGTNHLGHFALTAVLLPLLYRAPSPRVVNVSSLAHRGGKIEFNNLQGDHSYNPWRAYQQSKLANLLFTFELHRRSDANAWGLTSMAAHPGFALTELIDNGPGRTTISWRLSALLKFLSHSAAAGALPTLFAATSPAATPNGYYGPDGFLEMSGPVAPAFVARTAKDGALARKLWEVSENLTGVQWSIQERNEAATRRTLETSNV